MEPAPFRALVQQHLLPLFSGAQLVRGTSPSPSQRPAVVERGRHSIEIKPTQATSWCLTIIRDQPFARTAPGQVSEKQLAKAFVAQLAAMPEGFEASPFAADLMARLLAAIDQLEAWSNRSYEGQPIVAAVGFAPAGCAKHRPADPSTAARRDAQRRLGGRLRRRAHQWLRHDAAG